MVKNERKNKRGFLSELIFLTKESILASARKRLEKNNEFSKTLLNQESVLIWIVTISFIVMAFICIFNGYFGELPWLAVLCSCAWAAYGVSQACYYNKSKAENTQGGIKYDAVMAQLKAEAEEVTEESAMPEEEFAPDDEKI